jgi:hypothetical protein
MNKNYTQNDLLLYAYNETELNDSVRVQNAIDGDPLVEGEYKEIVSTIEALNKMLLEPDDKVMNRLYEIIGK